MSRKARVAILISGSGSNMAALVDAMGPDHPGQPVLVVSNKPDAGGLAKAAVRGVPTAVVPHLGRPKSDFEADLTATLRQVDPDIICLAGFMRVLSPEFTARWAGKLLNIHPSLLPLFKGLDTHARTLAAGMAVHGASVHRVTADLDDGPILGQAVIPVLPGDTPDALAKRLLPMEHRLYPAVLAAVLAGDPLPLALFPAPLA